MSEDLVKKLSRSVFGKVSFFSSPFFSNFNYWNYLPTCRQKKGFSFFLFLGSFLGSISFAVGNGNEVWWYRVYDDQYTYLIVLESRIFEGV